MPQDTATWNSNWQTHRWSGWPGAYCLTCHIEDQKELAMCLCEEFDVQTGRWQGGIVAEGFEIPPCPGEPHAEVTAAAADGEAEDGSVLVLGQEESDGPSDGHVPERVREDGASAESVKAPEPLPSSGDGDGGGWKDPGPSAPTDYGGGASSPDTGSYSGGGTLE